MDSKSNYRRDSAGSSGSFDPLEQSSQFVKGVGPARQILLERLGIRTVEDLLMHFPRSYYDRRNLIPIGRLQPGTMSTFLGTVLAVSARRSRRGGHILTVAVGDESGVVNLVFFNQPYLEKNFRQGEKVVASGELSIYRDARQVVSPEWETVGGELGGTLIDAGRIVPVYPLTAGITQRTMRRIVREALDKASKCVRENLTDSLMKRFDLPSRAEALRQIHYPDTMESLERARRRFKFEEIFFLHILLKQRRRNIAHARKRPYLPPPHLLLERFLQELPFELTAAQRKVLAEIEEDVRRPSGLNRLVQGEVGSGKTVVALAATMLAIGKGYQAAFMAPTEILAVQHYERARPICEKVQVRIALLIGSLPRTEKIDVQRSLLDGSVDLIVGTHALIQEGISFKQLGLAVIDEQHRFGVKQRAHFGKDEALLPHFLVMTATPIPRSLAQTVYGDLDLSVIDEIPSGPRKVVTEVVSVEERERVYAEVKAAFERGEQAFILYPLVEESEKSDCLAATEEFERLQRGEFSAFPIGLLHGRMSFEEKAKAVDLFRRREILGLVTTTVIEVGVDIPNASVLVVHHPERFGLAQLHQLRGRIGRTGRVGRCFLLLDEGTGSSARSRLNFFASHHDGFAVAEEDLRERGPGEIWGYRQSGLPSFRLVNPLGDQEMVKRSWEAASSIIEADPELKSPENFPVAEYFASYYKPKYELAEIG